jgi:hypothetical protein
MKHLCLLLLFALTSAQVSFGNVHEQRPRPRSPLSRPPPGVAEETAVLITGGRGSISELERYSSSEIYPTGCSVQALPSERSEHSTFATTGPSPKIVTCGGQTTQGVAASCLVLNVQNQLWEENVVDDLPQPRRAAASVSIENVGTYLIGGTGSSLGLINSMRRTSDFLEAGSTEWTAGPAIPVDVDMDRPCVVSISQLSFLIIHGNNILEYQVDTFNPTSSSRWQSGYPQLQTSRRKQPGCSKIGDQVVIAGGVDRSGYLGSTEVLNLSTRTIVYAGDLNSPRAWFHMATITMNGEQTLLAFGGRMGRSSYLNSVEHFNTTTNTWTFASTGMVEARWQFEAVALPREILCP